MLPSASAPAVCWGPLLSPAGRFLWPDRGTPGRRALCPENCQLDCCFSLGRDLFGQKPRFGMTWLSPDGSGSCPFSSSPDAQAPNSSPLSSKWESGVGRAQGTETQLPGWQSLQRRVPSALAKLPRASGIMTQVWALNSLGITNEGVLTSVDFVESVGLPFVSPQE